MKTLAELNQAFEVSTKSREFFETGRWMALARGRKAEALLLAKEGRATERVLAVLEKATAGTIAGGSGTWGSELTSLSLAFVASLANVGVFDTALPFMKQMPLQTRVAITIVGATGSEVDEGALKLISEIELANATLSPQKAVAAIVTSDELLKLGGASAAQLLQTELRTAVAAMTDQIFVDMLLDGLTLIVSTGDILTDLAALSEAITTGSGSKLFVVASPLNGKRIAFARTTDGAQLFPNGTGIVTVLVSDAMADDALLMFDAAQIAAAGGRVDIGTTGEANIDLGGGNIVSLWQTNRRAMRAERMFGCEKLRADSAAVLSGVAYTTGS
jgi:hypothetical protein